MKRTGISLVPRRETTSLAVGHTYRKEAWKIRFGPEGAEPFDPARVERILFIAISIRRFHLRVMIFLAWGKGRGEGGALAGTTT